MKEQDLFKVPVPEATESYAPVAHEQIVDLIHDNVDKTGLEIAGKHYKADRGGQKVIGIIDLKANSDTFNYRLLFRNSYDKSMSVAFVGGSSVMICSNGLILGQTDIQFIRKHTGTVAEELSEKITTVISGLEDTLGKVTRHAEQMKNIELDPTATAELCGRLFMEQDIINTRQLNIIRDQLNQPDHAEFSDPNLWSLYNHTTHALKTEHSRTYIDQYKKLHGFVEAEYSLD